MAYNWFFLGLGLATAAFVTLVVVVASPSAEEFSCGGCAVERSAADDADCHGC